MTPLPHFRKARSRERRAAPVSAPGLSRTSGRGTPSAQSNSELTTVLPKSPVVITAGGCSEQSRASRFLFFNHFTIKRACQPSDVNRCVSI